MPVLSSPRHERFAQELAKGKTQTEAYAIAGYKPSEQHASRLARNGKVIERLAELQSAAAERAEITAADIAKQLDEDREFARGLSSASAAVSATMGKAKVLGLIVDKQSHSGPNGGPIKLDLSGLPDELLDQAEALLGTILGIAHAGGHSGGAPAEGRGEKR